MKTRKIELTSCKGVGALLSSRQMRCDVDQIEFERALKWVEDIDQIPDREGHLELVKTGESDD